MKQLGMKEDLLGPPVRTSVGPRDQVSDGAYSFCHLKSTVNNLSVSLQDGLV